MRVFLTALFIFLSFNINAAADIKLFLFPNAKKHNDIVEVKDIARLQGTQHEIEKIRNVIIPGKICRDGYVDRQEISTFLKNYSDEKITVYGSAVKIVSGEKKRRLRKFGKNNTQDNIIKKGDRLRIVIRKNGISVKVTGTSLETGNIGDEILVRVFRQKKLKGKIMDRNSVEVNL